METISSILGAAGSWMFGMIGLILIVFAVVRVWEWLTSLR